MGYDIVAGSHKHEYFSTARAVDDEYFPLDPAKRHFLISLEDTYDLDLSCGKPRPGKGRVLGTQAFTWSGRCWNFFDLMYKTFPRACAVAEVAWGAPEPRDYRDFHRRMLVHAKRLRAMSIPCAPVDPPGSKRAIPAGARQDVAARTRPTVYTHYMDPSRHPDDARRSVKPPDRALLGDKTHFMALRHASGPNIKRYIDEDKMGDFVWTYWGYFLRSEKQLRAFIEEMRKRDLYIFDICAMLVGNAKPKGCYQFRMPDWAKKILEEEYGDHWLGMDNGEQDGAYVARDARGVEPTGLNRFAQYVAFQRHFEYMDLLLGNKIATLVSLTYGHQFLKENCYTMIGAETAQMLPNAQMYYSFIRGAGKQYGVPWFGNVSAFSRWGYKQYPNNPKDEDRGVFRRPHPLNGASLALMKKLMLAQIMYNSSAVGFEFGYYKGGSENSSKSEMSPIGKVHKSCQKWCDDHGQPGVMHAPVAVMMDFLSGWTFARHSYAGHATYRAWGALDFDEGDFFAHGVMDMLYPHYTNSGWWHDERGFNADTPYGDIADCLLTDAPAWLLDQYGCVVLATKIQPREETRAKLRSYVTKGGHLVLPRGNMKALFPEGFGDVGKGRVSVIKGSEWGVVETPKCKLPAIAQNDEEIGNPYPLTDAARAELDAAFREQMIFATSETPVENGLSIITCRRGKGEYTVAVLNNTWEEKPFSVIAKNGRIAKIEELAIDRPERGEPGYIPYGIGKPDVGRDTETTIAGGGVRTFRVWLAGEDVREVPECVPPPNPTGRFLFVRDFNGAIGPVKEALFRRPSFFQQYDGVMLDWRYLWSRSKDDVEEQVNWISLQQLKVGVDMASGLNLFPDMRLITNDVYETERTWRRIDDVLQKMEIIGAKTLVIAPHNRAGELSKDEYDAQFAGQVRKLCRKAAEKGITVYFRNVFHKQFKLWPRQDVEKIVASVGEPNLKVAPVLSVEEIVVPGKLAHGARMIARSGAELVYLALPRMGRTGHLDTYLGTLAGSGLPEKDVREALQAIKRSGAKVVFAPLYDNVDEEFRDLALWEAIDCESKTTKEKTR